MARIILRPVGNVKEIPGTGQPTEEPVATPQEEEGQEEEEGEQ